MVVKLCTTARHRRHRHGFVLHRKDRLAFELLGNTRTKFMDSVSTHHTYVHTTCLGHLLRALTPHTRFVHVHPQNARRHKRRAMQLGAGGGACTERLNFILTERTRSNSAVPRCSICLGMNKKTHGKAPFGFPRVEMSTVTPNCPWPRKLCVLVSHLIIAK